MEYFQISLRQLVASGGRSIFRFIGWEGEVVRRLSYDFVPARGWRVVRIVFSDLDGCEGKWWAEDYQMLWL